MKQLISIALMFSAVVLVSCDEPTTPEEKIAHAFHAKGTEYDLPWTYFDENGQQLSITRGDSVIRMFASDTTIMGRSGVYAFKSKDPNQPGAGSQESYIRVNKDNDLEVLFEDDDMTMEQWITLPVQTTSQKGLNVDTTLSEDNDTIRITGTITTKHAGDTTITIGGSSVTVIKCVMEADLEGKKGTTVIANLDGTRTLWYAPSLGYFAFIENKEEGINHNGDDHFKHTKEVMQRYRLQ